MSLVGTRPPTVDEWDKYELHHRARLATKPGLTGMWQVSGRSNITDLADRVHYFKEDEKGVAIMCKAMEDMRNEAAREAEKMKAIRMTRLMIEDGKLSYEDIAMYIELTLEEVEKIALEKKSA